MSVLSNLFYGKIVPESDCWNFSENNKAASCHLYKFAEEFSKTLSKEQGEEFEKLIDLVAKSNTVASEAAFVEGFRLGAKMIIEIIYTQGDKS